MSIPPAPRRPTSGPVRVLDDAPLVQAARALKCASDAGHSDRPLRGRHIGVLCDDIESEDATLFREAATELGAYVSHVTADVARPATGREFADTARTLGRLYDALECQGLPRDVVKRLGHIACVPCFDAASGESPRTAEFVRWTAECATPREARKFLLQAALLRSVGR